MKLEELREHPLYKSLSDPLRRFVETYCLSNGDSHAAALIAFPNLSKKLLPKYTKRAVENYAVAQLIVAWDGIEDVPDLERFKIVVWEMIKGNDKGLNKAALCDLLADVSGWKKTRAAGQPTTPSESFISELEGK